MASEQTSPALAHDEAVKLSKAIHTGSFISRLTTGTGAFDLVGKRRYYYMCSGFLVVASILVILLRGFHLGTDFAGGTTFTFVPSAGAANVSPAAVTDVLNKALGVGKVEAVQTLGGKTIQATLQALQPEQAAAGQAALATAYTPTGGIKGVSSSAVSSSWGAQISDRAIIAVIIFLVAVGLFIWVRYEKRVAVGAVLSTIHDVVVTAGIYALAGFEVTPATVIGLLTILGFSLYDTVVVYDKVQENAKGLTSLLRRTYPETANLAVNQTIMRSLNTSLIALLPVAGLLVAGVAVLGGGTLKDLALVLLVGMLVGAYSSIFVAVPIAVDLKIREPTIRAHTARVLAKRKSDGLIVDADGDPVGRKTLPGQEPVRRTTVGVSPPTVSGLKAGAAPKPGVKPQRPGRPASAKVQAGKPVVSKSATSLAERAGSDPDGSPTVRPKAKRPTPGDGAATAADAHALTTDAPAADAHAAATPARAEGTPARAEGTAARPAATPARPAGKPTRPTGKRGR